MIMSALAAVALIQATPAQQTERVTEAYVQAMQARDWEQLTNLVSADDFHFTDRASPQWDGQPFLDVTGRDPFVEMQKSWGAGPMQWAVDQKFVVGEWGVYYGRLGPPDQTPQMKFLATFRVRNGLIVERHDIGDYLDAAGTRARNQAETEETRRVAEAYGAAYQNEDWDALRELVDDEISFFDPTASIFGPPYGVERVGPDEMLGELQPAFENIENLEFNTEFSFVAKNHSVEVGTASFEMPGSAVNADVETVRLVHRFVKVVEVREGKVVFHRDYVDYSNFNEQIAAQR